MLVRPAEQSFGKGIEALARGEAVKALAMFEAAIRLDRKFRSETRPQPRYLSYYGLCLGLESHRWKEAVDLCREAVGAESYNPDLHLNLGRVLVAAGRRKEGWEALQRGLLVDEAHEGLRRAIAAMGVRNLARRPQAREQRRSTGGRPRDFEGTSQPCARRVDTRLRHEQTDAATRVNRGAQRYRQVRPCISRRHGQRLHQGRGGCHEGGDSGRDQLGVAVDRQCCRGFLMDPEID